MEQVSTEVLPMWVRWCIVVAVFGGVLGIWGLCSHLYVRRMKEFARRFGLQLHDGRCGDVRIPAHFSVTEYPGITGADGHVRASIEGERDGIAIAIIEYYYATEGAQGMRTVGYRFPLACVTAPGLELARFHLEPERLRHKLSSAFGGEDIDFADAPRFSRLFRLRGDHAPGVRDIFSKETRSFFEERPGALCEGEGDTFVYYRRPRMWRLSRFRPKTAERLLEEGIRLAKLFQNHG